MRKITNSPDRLALLERMITSAIQNRIDRNPDAEDYCLRINPDPEGWVVLTVSLPVSVTTERGHDYPLYELMIDRNNLPGHEYWEPDPEAIHRLAQSYAHLYEINLCLN